MREWNASRISKSMRSARRCEDVAEVVGEEAEKHAGEVVGRACDVLDEVVGSKWVGDVLSKLIEEEQASLARERSGPV